MDKLSKPVAWEVKGILCHSEEEARIYVGEPEPLYSQEYVSALLAENERVARDLAARNGEIEGLRKRAAELEAKLATPVRLPDALIPAVHASGEPFMRPEPFGFYLNRDDVIKKLRAAGFTVEGDSE